ncbi:hypothetical protein C8C76_11727 [Halanaerobium saccharolyticum]|uniref:Uncharacterized protein n=1 Tax=Halanaerobium saccharolyticum TaxID=43595 RepID=A0A2T5RJ05_9FIRM|nr:hypothetical protein [Halanaerobium saccharolyticum]PTV98370.1 hypothetical protein C8C76_11727 [Halanaerobium saccharolyticum]
MKNQLIFAPNKQYKVELELVDMYQPKLMPSKADNFIPYYKISVNQKRISNRYFSSNYKWSLCSRYFIIEEWFTNNSSNNELINALENIIVKLTIFDLNNNMNGLVATNKNGRIIPKEINEKQIIYIKDNKGLYRELEVNLVDINWKKDNDLKGEF